jgi:RNA-directed DNA polymerase
LIRYADDLVVLHADLTLVQQCQQMLSEWLTPVGLTLHPSKIRITHTRHPHEGNLGFDFLGRIQGLGEYPCMRQAETKR